MTIAIFSLAFLVLGYRLGYVRGHVRSEDRFSKMCDDGQLVWRYEEDDGESGWDGEPEALEDCKQWLMKQ